jgi:hypothetical protein
MREMQIPSVGYGFGTVLYEKTEFGHDWITWQLN